MKILWSTPWSALISLAAIPSRLMKWEQSAFPVDWSVVWGIFRTLCPSQQSGSTWKSCTMHYLITPYSSYCLTWNHCVLGTWLCESAAQGQHICCLHSACSTGSVHHISSRRDFQGWVGSLFVQSPCKSLSGWYFYTPILKRLQLLPSLYTAT